MSLDSYLRKIIVFGELKIITRRKENIGFQLLVLSVAEGGTAYVRQLE